MFGNPKYTWFYQGDARLNVTGEAQFNPGANYSYVDPQLYFDLPSSGVLQSLGKSTTFRASLEQNGDAASPSLVNKYTINWHFPWENIRPFGEPDWEDYEHLEPAEQSGGPAISGEHITASRDWHPYFIATWARNLAALAFTVASAATDPPLAVWLAAAGGGTSLLPDPQSKTNEEVSFEDCWQWDDSAWPSGTGAANKPADADRDLYEMYGVRLSVGYKHAPREGDAYNTNGFAGVERKVVKAHNGRLHWSGLFRLRFQEP